MAHFAELDENNIVTRVVVIHNNELLNDNGIEEEKKGIDFCVNLFNGGRWVQTSYNDNFRKNYAGTGFKYDEIRDAFIPPKIFSSWTLNEKTCQWEPPVSYPTDGLMYFWNEENQIWDQLGIE